MTDLLANTLGVRCEADRVSFIHSVADAQRVVRHALDRGEPMHLLGGASNVVLLPRVRSTVAVVCNRGIERLTDDGRWVTVRVAAGEVWESFVQWCLDHGVPGPENLTLIPGTVGAAPIQNIGAYGVEVSAFIEMVEAVDLRSGEVAVLSADECAFSYRHSRFKAEATFLITAVRMRFDRRRSLSTDYPGVAAQLNAETPQGVADAVRTIRRSKLPDPQQIGNVGSFFKNPVVSREAAARLAETVPDLVTYDTAQGCKLAAAQLIDRAGWRGARRYGVRVWDKQPLVLVNDGARSGEQFLRMAQDIRTDIHHRFGVELEREPVVIGET